MDRSLRYLLAASALLISGCAGDQLAPAKTFRPAAVSPSSVVLPCPSDPGGTVDSLLPQLFKPGNGRRGTAQGYDNDIDKALRTGDQAGAELYADSLINFTLAQYFSNELIGGQSDETKQRVEAFFTALYCYIGLEPIDFSTLLLAENTKFIRFNSPPTEVSADSAAVLVETGDVPTTVFGTFVSVYKTTNPLPTSLDWYGADGFKAGAYEFVSNPEVTFTNPVLVGVCIKFDDAVVGQTDLRLAHHVPAGSSPTPGTDNYVVTTAGGTIEISEYVDPTPLFLVNGECPPLPPPPTAYRGLLGRLRQFARLILPAQLYAGVSGGSTGGQVVKFSPFAAVDTKLNLSSTGPSSPQYMSLFSTAITKDVTATVVTRYNKHYGNTLTPINGVQVAFAPSASFAPASATTGTNGTATSTWTLVDGTNTATVTPSLGGLEFVPAQVTYDVVVNKETVTLTPTTAIAGTEYSGSLTTSGNNAYQWTSSAVPLGLTLDPDGKLHGWVPIGASGAYPFDVTVSSGALSTTVTVSLTVTAPSGITLVFKLSSAPSKQNCYAVNKPMSPVIEVEVHNGPGGALLSGVTVYMHAETNNGSWVTVTPDQVTSVGGYARFDDPNFLGDAGPTINKTGGYALVASTTSPHAASLKSGKFNISPSCS
jgi:hypothetical protein